MAGTSLCQPHSEPMGLIQGLTARSCLQPLTPSGTAVITPELSPPLYLLSGFLVLWPKCSCPGRRLLSMSLFRHRSFSLTTSNERSEPQHMGWQEKATHRRGHTWELFLSRA